MHVDPQRRSYLFGLTVFALLTVIWGYNWIAMKIGLMHAAPFDFAALRTTCGVITLFAVLIIMRRPLRPPSVPATLLLGLFQTTGFISFTTLALVTGGAGKTSVLVFTMPFWTLILSWPLLGEKIRGLQWLAIALALAGLLLIIEPWQLQGTPMSKILAVVGGICWAASIVVAKKLRARHSVDLIALTAWQMLFGTVPIVAIALLRSAPPIDWTPGFVVALGYAGFLGTSLGWLMWLFVLNRVPAGTAGLNALAIPVVAVVVAWIQLGERPGGVELLGMIAIAIALSIIAWIGMRETRARRAAAGSRQPDRLQ